MKKSRTVFVCAQCGAESSRWNGQCMQCGAWNTMNEEIRSPKAAEHVPVFSETPVRAVPLADLPTEEEERLAIGNDEWDRAVGGGIVSGSLLLLGGDPGIGKSTLILQVAAALGRRGHKVLYASGEESAAQIGMRARRLAIAGEKTYLLATTDLARIIDSAREITPEVLIIDSIQTMVTANNEGIAGSISQVKECTETILRFAKETGTAVMIIGHVTKEGNIAGPRMLEHMVDTVLYLEGEKEQPLRMLRAVKNRFGDTAESGVFVMQEKGLRAVADFSRLMLSERSHEQIGTMVFPGMEGIRPVLVEVQALTNRMFYGSARRTAIGYDYNRLALLLAVLEKKAGVATADDDVYVNVVGGIKINDPGIDLAVALAIVSVARGAALPGDWAAMGEISLTGEVRRVRRVEKRLTELTKMGFRKVLLPQSDYLRLKDKVTGISLAGIAHVRDAVQMLTIGK